jgi:succinate-semialdehyde dehydrogenase/glutarate-semialdehyde dehydrogenase
MGKNTYYSADPLTGKVQREYPELTAGDCERLLAGAHGAFNIWRAESTAARAAACARLADLVLRDKDLLARAATADVGKPLADSLAEVDVIANVLRYYADRGVAMLAETQLNVAGYSEVVVRREATGVTLGIEPWNVPYYQAIRTAAPNLMLGNAVLIKPAEQCAASTLMLDPLVVEAGFPEHVFQTALLSHDQVAQVIADPRVRAVGFTGSEKTGALIGALASRHIKPVTLELGGSDAFVVLDSADVAKAAAVAASCRLMIGGQVCTSPKRMIVTDKVADEFTGRLVGTFTRQVVGDPFDPGTTVGPLSSATVATRVQEQLQDAIDKGATVLVQGGQTEPGSAWFRPAALTDISPDMRVFTEEVFGPVAMVYRVPDMTAALELANSTRYGLGGTIFAQDLDEARAAAAGLDTGMIGINSYLGGPPEIPFGGTKASGIGRELGPDGMDAFANVKTYAFA